MFERRKQLIIFVLFLCCFVSVLLSSGYAQDEAVDEKIVGTLQADAGAQTEGGEHV